MKSVTFVSMKNILTILSLGIFFTVQGVAQENSLLWEIESPSGKTSYLFGTYHLVGSDYLTTHPKVDKAYREASTVVVETVIDSTKMMEMAMMGMMPGKSLRKLVDSADYALLSRELMRVTGYDIAMFDQMKPMTIIALYLVSLAEDAIGDQPELAGQPIDVYFAANGKKSGKQVRQLETMMEQAEILYNSETVEEQAEMLVAAVKDSTENEDSTTDLLQAYNEENLKQMWEMANSEESDYWDMSLLLDNRNERWIDTLKPILDEGGAFIAVGALHLPGNTGLIKLLTAEGYRLKAVH